MVVSITGIPGVLEQSEELGIVQRERSGEQTIIGRSNFAQK